MKRRSVLSALAMASAFALSACGNDKAAAPPAPQQAPAATASAPAADRIDMVIFLDPAHCPNSQAMQPEVEAFLSSPAAHTANVTVVDAATPEGYDRMQHYRVNGVAFNVVPTIVVLRNDEIIGGSHGRMTSAQITSLLESARTPYRVTATTFDSSDITARYRTPTVPAAPASAKP